jgi:hypothetical protein
MAELPMSAFPMNAFQRLNSISSASLPDQASLNPMQVPLVLLLVNYQCFQDKSIFYLINYMFRTWAVPSQHHGK